MTCQYVIYYSNVAYKSNEPDIHGTLMFTWLLAFYGKITKNKSLEFLNKSLEKLANGEYPLEELVVTKTLRGFYKNPQQIPHKVLADRMKKRDPGSAPQANDRVPYVYIQIKEEKGKKLLQGDKIEDPKFIREKYRICFYRKFYSGLWSLYY